MIMISSPVLVQLNETTPSREIINIAIDGGRI